MHFRAQALTREAQTDRALKWRHKNMFQGGLSSGQRCDSGCRAFVFYHSPVALDIQTLLEKAHFKAHTEHTHNTHRTHTQHTHSTLQKMGMRAFKNLDQFKSFVKLCKCTIFYSVLRVCSVCVSCVLGVCSVCAPRMRCIETDGCHCTHAVSIHVELRTRSSDPSAVWTWRLQFQRSVQSP